MSPPSGSSCWPLTITASPALRPAVASISFGVVNPTVIFVLCAFLSAPATMTNESASSCSTASTGTTSTFWRFSATISTRTGVPAASFVAVVNETRTSAETPVGSTAAGRLNTLPGSGSSAPGTMMRAAWPSCTRERSASATEATTCSLFGSITRRMTSVVEASTMSPGLCTRLATTPGKVARTTVRAATSVAFWSAACACPRAAFASARSRCASSSSFCAATPCSTRVVRRVTEACAFCTCASAVATSPRRVETSVCSDGMSNRTSRSPGLTRSPSAFGISAMRPCSGAVIIQSAPGAALTTPLADTTPSSVCGASVTVVTEAAAFVSTCSTAVLPQPDRSSAGAMTRSVLLI